MKRRVLRPGLAHAARVALAASLLVCVVYAGCVAVLNVVISARLTGEVDATLRERVSDVSESPPLLAADEDDDTDSVPVYLWRVTGTGLEQLRGPAVTAAGTPAAPTLPVGLDLDRGMTRTLLLRQGTFRVYAAGKYVAAQGLGDQEHLLAVLRDGEALAAPVLLLAMFIGALTIGLRALSPVEQSRRRQLEFTADASHELRTPLSVISAETSIALSAPRDPAAYQAALTRISGENGRLQRIVEDMLWLARFDSAPPQPGYEPVDLDTIAAECARRFAVLARSRGVSVVADVSAGEPALISAPAEWVDRLAGVLADNACRYAGSAGIVRISVTGRGNRVCLTVEDSGPGIAPDHRDRLFDRFHRSTEGGGSAGLGLAIADSIARSTGGQWQVGESELGGASFEVSWRRAAQRQHASTPAGWRRPRGGKATDPATGGG